MASGNRKVRRCISGALLLIAAALSVAPGHASAITYGTPDGALHPNVGAMVAQFDDTRYQICSGTLIAPTVFLTASHCTAYLESQGISQVWVTFDPVFSSDATLISGTMHTNPAYNQAQSDPQDIAVITLSQPAAGITPASLPAAGLFDSMATRNGLKDQTFTAVGYGTTQPTLTGGRPVFGGNGTRRVAISTFNALNKAWLRLSQNNATGNGGTCYGDSGGPDFLGTSDTIAAITITGDTMCFATNVDYRLDTPSARAYLARYVTLP
jgi:secreted trypsin-like serine protease